MGSNPSSRPPFQARGPLSRIQSPPLLQSRPSRTHCFPWDLEQSTRLLCASASLSVTPGGGVTAAPPSFQRFLGGGGDVCKRPHPVPGSGDVPGRRRRCLSAPADETPALTLASPHPTGSAGSSRTPPSSGRSAALALARRRLGMEPVTWMRTRTCRYRWPRGPADTGGLEPPGLAGLALGHRPPAGPGPPAR